MEREDIQYNCGFNYFHMNLQLIVLVPLPLRIPNRTHVEYKKDLKTIKLP